MIEVVPDSKSVILRSTHIVLLRVLNFQASNWERHDNARDRRTAQIQFGWLETLKGRVEPPSPSPVTLAVSQYKNAGLLKLPLPGVYTSIRPEPGNEYVVFCRTQSAAPPEIPNEQHSDLVQPAENALVGVRLAVGAMARELKIVPLLAEAKAHIASLDAIFSEFVWERYRAEILSSRESYDAYLSFIQEPALPAVARSVLLNGVYSAVSEGTRPADQADPLALTMFHLLAMPQAQPLHDGLIQVLLPNLLGLQGEGPQHRAEEIFQHSSEKREAARKALENYQGTVDKSLLISWLQ